MSFLIGICYSVASAYGAEHPNICSDDVKVALKVQSTETLNARILESLKCLCQNLLHECKIVIVKVFVHFQQGLITIRSITETRPAMKQNKKGLSS